MPNYLPRPTASARVLRFRFYGADGLTVAENRVWVANQQDSSLTELPPG